MNLNTDINFAENRALNKNFDVSRISLNILLSFNVLISREKSKQVVAVKKLHMIKFTFANMSHLNFSFYH